MNLLGDGAKPWKAVLSSDGLSDVGTPIFCLRRGKSGKARDSTWDCDNRFTSWWLPSGKRPTEARFVNRAEARTRVEGRTLGKL